MAWGGMVTDNWKLMLSAKAGQATMMIAAKSVRFSIVLNIFALPVKNLKVQKERAQY